MAGVPMAGRLLIASPKLVDPNFARTVVLLLDVDDDGVLGVVLNRPSEVPVSDVLLDWAPVVGDPEVLFQGGPVGLDSALGVASLGAAGPAPLGWRRLFDATGVVDLDAPTELLGPAVGAMRIYAGYAGWGPGQLQEEIEDGGWYVVPAAAEDLYCADPSRLWRQVLRRQPGDLVWLASMPVDPTQN